MIDRIEGEVLQLEPTHAVIGVGGIGFHVAITVRAYEILGRSKQARLYTHLHVREDAMLLFGFIDPTERAAFLALIAISGVGPKVARAILSSVSPDILRDSVAAGDWKRLTAAPGVGRKLAERMVVELRDRLGDAVVADDEASGGAAGYSGRAGEVREAVEALVTLGHSSAQAEKLVAKAARAADEGEGVEGLLRRALSS